MTSPIDPENQPAGEPAGDPVNTPDGEDTTTSKRQKTSQQRQRGRRQLKAFLGEMEDTIGEINRAEEALDLYTTMDIGQEELIELLADLRTYALVANLDFEIATAESCLTHRSDLGRRITLGLICQHGQMTRQIDPALAEHEIVSIWNERATELQHDLLQEMASQIVRDLHAEAEGGMDEP